MEDAAFAQRTVQSILLAKLRNSKLVLMRVARTERAGAYKEELMLGVQQLNEAVANLLECSSVDSMRGIEGAAATSILRGLTICLQAIQEDSPLTPAAAARPEMR